MEGKVLATTSTNTGDSANRQKTKARPPPPPFVLPLNIVFSLCITAHLLAASNAPIQDCDETFNYWEPLHYLVHGYGLQTWEYSPEYGIRSWAYIALHALPTKLASFVTKSKVWEFYAMRCLLAGVCAATETRLYATISRTLNPRIGTFYIMVVAFTPGFFYASVAFLPSAFAMYTSTLGLSAFMDRRNGPKTATTIMYFAVGALLGWPFAAALIVPFALEDWTIAFISGAISDTFLGYLEGIVRALVILVFQVGTDSLFYRKAGVVVPWNIVAYNVFGGKDKGPDIFGTEPWHFYVRNLLLNFNMWYILAMAAAPLLIIQSLFIKQGTTKQTVLRTITLIAPFYLWFTIFTLQPHKEERFMFPAYPFLALNAAIALEMLLSWFGSSDKSTIIGKLPPRVKLLFIMPIILGSINIGMLRIVGTVISYRAPLRIYDGLQSSSNLSSPSTAVCLGKDWYRFPTSFFLPDSVHAKFIKSEFSGLLPGEFAEGKLGPGIRFPDTWVIPDGMNDRNEEDPGKYVDIRHCDYLVDSIFPSTVPTDVEPDYSQSQKWETVACEPFMDNVASSLIARTIWTPDFEFIPSKFRRVWGKHCLLRRKPEPKSTFDYLPHEKLGINELP